MRGPPAGRPWGSATRRVPPGPAGDLAAGVQVKIVSERLGHASIGITLDTYSHVMPGMQEEAAEKIDAGLRAVLTSEALASG